jgi:hypothetical protein
MRDLLQRQPLVHRHADHVCCRRDVQVPLLRWSVVRQHIRLQRRWDLHQCRLDKLSVIRRRAAAPRRRRTRTRCSRS